MRAPERVQSALTAAGIDAQIVELPDSTRTAVEAAKAVGCEVAQIAKSLVFRGRNSGDPVLIIASGANRVDEKKVEAAIGEPIEKADAAFVRERTGYAIGGIPPAGHATAIRTFLDRALLSLGDIWAAAGTPHAVFRITADDLQKLTGGTVIDV